MNSPRKVSYPLNQTRNPVTGEPIIYDDDTDPDVAIWWAIGRGHEVENWRPRRRSPQR